MPIRGLSEQKRLPRLGKLRLGKKVPNKSGDGMHPEATDYFVIPDELKKVLKNDTPTELPIMIPVEDDETWCNQYYKRYSSYRGLTCKGDGVSCWRMIDKETGAMAGRDTKEVVWQRDLPCDGRKCIHYMAKECKETMNLQFIMPDLPGLGVWQIDTSSINSIKNINNAAAMIRAVYKRIAFIPLMLTLEPIEVVNPDDGKKKVVKVLNLRTRSTMRELLAQSSKQAQEWLLLPEPAEDEAPDDDGTYPAEAVRTPKTDTKEDPDWDKLQGSGGQPKPDAIDKALGTPIAVEAAKAEAAKNDALTPERIAQAEKVIKEADEILEGKSKPATTANGGKKEKPKRDPATVKNFGELYTACREDWPETFKGDCRKAVWKELGVDSQEMLTDSAAECYRKIAAVRQG